MDFVALTEKIVKSLVLDEEAVRVKQFPSENENMILLEVMVPESDLGRVIGKNGRTAAAIRTLVQASSVLHENKYIKINFDKF